MIKKKTVDQENARDVWYNNWAGYVYSPVGKDMDFKDWAYAKDIDVIPPVVLTQGPTVAAKKKVALNLK